MKHMPTILVILARRGRGRGLRVGGQPGLQCLKKYLKKKKIKGEREERKTEERRKREGEKLRRDL